MSDNPQEESYEEMDPNLLYMYPSEAYYYDYSQFYGAAQTDTDPWADPATFDYSQYRPDYGELDGKQDKDENSIKNAEEYFEKAAVAAGEAIAYVEPLEVEEQEGEGGAVPYPEGYIPSVTNAFLKRQEEEKKGFTNVEEETGNPNLFYGNPYASKPLYEQQQKSKSSVDTTKNPKRFLRAAGDEVWEDASLNEWDPNDYRIFVGDLGVEVSDHVLSTAFNKYPSFIKAKVVRDKKSHKSKGYGFVSFKDPNDFVKALREMNGKYIGSRPIQLRKSTWNERNISNNSLRRIQGHAGAIKKRKLKLPDLAKH